MCLPSLISVLGQRQGTMTMTLSLAGPCRSVQKRGDAHSYAAYPCPSRHERAGAVARRCWAVQVAETAGMRVKRVWLSGSKAGTVDVLVDNLPGCAQTFGQFAPPSLRKRHHLRWGGKGTMLRGRRTKRTPLAGQCTMPGASTYVPLSESWPSLVLVSRSASELGVGLRESGSACISAPGMKVFYAEINWNTRGPNPRPHADCSQRKGLAACSAIGSTGSLWADVCMRLPDHCPRPQVSRWHHARV